tara:strand:+ start:1366 stop:1518 length:153 start_codon:yes stop_codon:yes gene_type:complete
MEDNTVKITIELEVESDESCEAHGEALREAVYQYLMELIDDDALDFTIER